MVIDQIHIERIALLESEDNPPVPRNAHTPEAFQTALEPMKPVPRHIEGLGPVRHVQAAQNVFDPVEMIRSYLALIASLVEPFQAPMLESSDHDR